MVHPAVPGSRVGDAVGDAVGITVEMSAMALANGLEKLGTADVMSTPTVLDAVGTSVGVTVGMRLGISVGCRVDAVVGESVGVSDGDGVQVRQLAGHVARV